MTPPEAKRLVVVGVVGTGTLSAVAAFRRGDRPSVRLAVGVFATGAILAVAAEVAPDLAAGIAILALTTSAFVLGGDAWAGIAEATSAKSYPTGTYTGPPNGAIGAGVVAGGALGTR